MLSLLLVSKGVVPYTKFQLRILITFKKIRPRILIGSKTTGSWQKQNTTKHVWTARVYFWVTLLLHVLPPCQNSCWRCVRLLPPVHGALRVILFLEVKLCKRRSKCRGNDTINIVFYVWRKTAMSLFQNMETQCLFLTSPFQTAKHLVTRCTSDVTKLLFSRNRVAIIIISHNWQMLRLNLNTITILKHT